MEKTKAAFQFPIRSENKLRKYPGRAYWTRTICLKYKLPSGNIACYPQSSFFSLLLRHIYIPGNQKYRMPNGFFAGVVPKHRITCNSHSHFQSALGAAPLSYFYIAFICNDLYYHLIVRFPIRLTSECNFKASTFPS